MNAILPFSTPDDLPINYEAEQELLGALLFANEILPRVATILRPEDFADHVHGRIFSAIAEQIRLGRAASPLTLKDQFDRDPALSSQGGARYLVRLMAGCSRIRCAEDVAHVVRDLAGRRKLIQLAGELAAEARDVRGDRSAATIAAEASSTLITEVSSAAGDSVEIADVAEEFVNGMDAPIVRHATGLPSLDGILAGGLYPGKLYGLIARMKAGKTTLLSTIAYNAASTGARIRYIPLEMGRQQITQRLLARKMGVNSLAFLDEKTRRQGPFITRAAHAAVWLRNLPLRFDGGYRSSLADIRQTVARAAMVERCQGVIVDYLQLVTGQQRGQSQASHIDEVTQSLAEMVQRYGIWIIVAAQENQDGNVRGGEGLRNAADWTGKLHKVTLAGGSDRAWIETMDSRYTLRRDAGSDGSPAFLLDVKAGPAFIEENPPEPGEDMPWSA